MSVNDLDIMWCLAYGWRQREFRFPCSAGCIGSGWLCLVLGYWGLTHPCLLTPVSPSAVRGGIINLSQSKIRNMANVLNTQFYVHQLVIIMWNPENHTLLKDYCNTAHYCPLVHWTWLHCEHWSISIQHFLCGWLWEKWALWVLNK